MTDTLNMFDKLKCHLSGHDWGMDRLVEDETAIMKADAEFICDRCGVRRKGDELRSESR